MTNKLLKNPFLYRNKMRQSMMDNYIIRFAQQSDLKQIIDLCEEHAAFENADYNRQGKHSKLMNELFYRQKKNLSCLVVDRKRKLLAYASYMIQYSTWEASEYMYMDCLFVREAERGNGIGEQLIKKIQEEARKQSCYLIQWQTPDFNTRAMDFYKRLGAKSKRKERFFLAI